MDLGFTAAEEAFRQEVRGWLEANLPNEWRHKGVGGFREEEETDLQRQWQRRLHEAGWLKLAWPKEAGGRDACGSSPAVPAHCRLLPFRLLIQKQLVRTARSIRTQFRTDCDQVMLQREQVGAKCSSSLRALIHVQDLLYG